MKNTVLLILSLFLLSCDYGVEWRDEPYEVIWIDSVNNRSLNHQIDENSSIGRVDAEVIAVGSDANYVVAKQKLTETGSVSYYYIDRSKDVKYLNADEVTQGPFSEVRFAQLKADLGLPEFSEEF